MRGCYRAVMGDQTFRSVRPARARFVATIGFAAAAMLSATACQPAATEGLPILSAPGEIVMAGVRSTAALHSVHARIDLTVRDAGGQQLGGGQFDLQSSLEVDMNLDTRDYASRSLTAGQGEPGQTTETIEVGGRQFTRNPPATRWMQFPNFGGQQPFPSNEELVSAIAAVVEGSGAVLQLEDPVACGAATCYHVIVDLDAASAWKVLAPIIVGGPANGPPPAEFPVPPVTLHVYVDQATRAMISVSAALTLMGTSLTLEVGLSNHDVPVQIVAPPPALVDQLDANFGGGFLGPVHAEAPVAPPSQGP